MNNKKIVPAIVILLAVIGIASYLYNAHTYDFEEHERFICVGEGKLLHVTTATPKEPSNKYVFIVHGDGPIDASHQSLYYPIWEVLTNNGWNVVSWDKPGIGQSRGDWLQQSMEDRIQETKRMIGYFNDADEIVVLGMSQAGWVVPRVVEETQAVRGILISPAINWHEQMEFQRQQTLTPEEHKRLEQYMRQGKYEDYVAAGGDLSRARFGFMQKNLDVDVRQDLRKLTKPIVLIGGSSDQEVDIEKTFDTYEEIVSDDLLTTYWIEGVDHEMIPESYKPIRRWVKAYLAPRTLYSEQYLKTLNEITS